MILKFGKITEVDASKGLAKVNFVEDDDLVTRFLPMSMPKTLRDKYIIPYDINEHVWCIMDENCEEGVIGGAIYDESNTPANGSNAKNSVQFDGNMNVEYDRSTGTLAVSGGTLIRFFVDNTEVNLQNGVLIKRGEETLKKVISDLIDQINLIVVPTNVGPSGNPINAPAFAAIKTRVAALLK